MPHIGEEQALTSSAASSSVPVVGASPFTWTATDSGTVVVVGGTVSNIELGRGAVFVSVTNAQRAVTVSRGDQLRVTYTAAPTMAFFPR